MTRDDLTQEQREAIEFIAQRAIDGYRDGLRAKVLLLDTSAGNRWGHADYLVWRSDVLSLIDGGTR